MLILLELKFDKQAEALKWYNEAIAKLDKNSFSDLLKQINGK
jgi:hypothetical protein